VQDYASRLTDLARQLNAFATTLKVQRRGSRVQPTVVREAAAEYVLDWQYNASLPLFSPDELEWLETVANI
jgi:hypothetical protein